MTWAPLAKSPNCASHMTRVFGLFELAGNLRIEREVLRHPRQTLGDELERLVRHAGLHGCERVVRHHPFPAAAKAFHATASRRTSFHFLLGSLQLALELFID